MKLKEEQLKLATKVSLVDGFEKINTIAGIDNIYSENKIISMVVVLDFKTLSFIESKYSIVDATFPYLPGFLSYREAPVAIETFNKLSNKPDLLMVDGNGILHPRKMGLASHLGLALDIPTIGVAKKLLCGELKGDTVYLEKDVIGKEIQTKDAAKPIYVSPGHKISFRTAVEITRQMLQGHKMPEPIYVAHKLGAKIKGKMGINVD